MKKLVMILLCCFMVGSVSPAWALSFYSGITITINEQIIPTNREPIEQNGSVLVLSDVITQGLDAEVEIKDDGQEIILTKGSRKIELALDEKMMVSNGKKKVIDVAPTIDQQELAIERRYLEESEIDIENFIMFPLRVIAEELGYKVYFHDGFSDQVSMYDWYGVEKRKQEEKAYQEFKENFMIKQDGYGEEEEVRYLVTYQGRLTQEEFKQWWNGHVEQEDNILNEHFLRLAMGLRDNYSDGSVILKVQYEGQDLGTGWSYDSPRVEYQEEIIEYVTLCEGSEDGEHRECVEAALLIQPEEYKSSWSSKVELNLLQ